MRIVTSVAHSEAMKVAVNGIQVHVEVSGRSVGPVLVCLHSLATDIDVWERQLHSFEQYFRVVRPDFRGHGITEVTPPPYSIGELCADTVGLLDALGIRTVSVIGVSLGAVVALGLALDNPDRVERVVAADCRADAPEGYVDLWDRSIATAVSRGMEPVIESSLERWFSASLRAAEPELIATVRERALRTHRDGFVGCARAVQGLSYLPRLSEIDVPVLFVVGSEDPAATPEVMRDMASRVRRGALVELEGMGHLTPLEGGDVFTSAVLPFLTSATIDAR
jgi:3-oxoadipate enol-lactonase